MNSPVFSAYIALGSNLSGSDESGKYLSPKQWIELAVECLRKHVAISALDKSQILISDPMGPQNQPVYANACVRIETSLKAEELLDLVQSLEVRAGRERKRRWGERTLDLDILNHLPLYNHNKELLQRLQEDALTPIIQGKRLVLPHPELERRDFVLLPLQQVIREDWPLDIGRLLGVLKKRFTQE